MLVIDFVNFVRNNKRMSNLQKKKKKKMMRTQLDHRLPSLRALPFNNNENLMIRDQHSYITKVNMTNILQLTGL